MSQAPNPGRGSILGYLAAFTLGIVCASVLFWAQRETAHSSRFARQNPGDATGATAASVRGRPASADFVPSTPPRVKPIAFAVTGPESAPSTNVSATNTATSGERAATLPVQTAETLVLQAENYFPGSPAQYIGGKVTLQGVPPPERALPLDPQCAAEHAIPPATRFYVVAPDGGLADVVVFVSEGLPRRSWGRPAARLVLFEKGCLLEPYMAAAMTGQTIQVRNLDPVMHNVHVTPAAAGNEELNLAQMPKGRPLEFTLNAPELHTRIKCDVHPWELSYVSVFDHPFYAVSNERGEFSLPALPAGKYTIEAHHRKAGLQKREIEIGVREVNLNFTLQVPVEVQANSSK